MGWKVVATMRYHRQHPDPKKRGKVFSLPGITTYETRSEAERQAVGSAKYDKVLGRRGVVYSVKEVPTSNPMRGRRIPAALRTLALKHHISVRMDESGFTIWDSRDPNSVKHPLYANTTKGAMARVRRLIRSR